MWETCGTEVLFQWAGPERGAEAACNQDAGMRGVCAGSIWAEAMVERPRGAEH